MRLKNIALIESLELGFQKGFSVFTGETGAGKSVFLFAIDYLLGGGGNQSGARLMRVGTENSFIEGCFSIDPNVKSWLEQNSFDVSDDEIYISRDWKRKDSGIKSRIRLNGEIINKKQILSLRPKLIDLAQQGQSDHLSSSVEQLKLLDRFGFNTIETALLDVKRSWKNWQQIKLKLENALKDYENQEADFLNIHNFLEDFKKANIEDPLEEKHLKEEEDRLVHGVKLQDSLRLIFSILKPTIKQR